MRAYIPSPGTTNQPAFPLFIVFPPLNLQLSSHQPPSHLPSLASHISLDYLAHIITFIFVYLSSRPHLVPVLFSVSPSQSILLELQFSSDIDYSFLHSSGSSSRRESLLRYRPSVSPLRSSLSGSCSLDPARCLPLQSILPIRLHHPPPLHLVSHSPSQRHYHLHLLLYRF